MRKSNFFPFSAGNAAIISVQIARKTKVTNLLQILQPCFLCRNLSFYVFSGRAFPGELLKNGSASGFIRICRFLVILLKFILLQGIVFSTRQDSSRADLPKVTSCMKNKVFPGRRRQANEQRSKSIRKAPENHKGIAVQKSCL